MNGSFRVDFVGIGAPKAGTSWLAKALGAHPEICISAKKETNFFCKNTWWDRRALIHYNGRNIGQYSLFFKRCRPRQIKGEFTVWYMLEDTAAEDIHRNFPDTKIIAILREPVARLLSHYRYKRYWQGKESRELEDVLDADEELVQHGMYGANLQRYFDLFPRKNILILFYEDLRRNAYQTLREVYGFLGVDREFVPEKLMAQRVNPTMKARLPFLRTLVEGVRYALIWLGIEWMVSPAVKRSVAGVLQRTNYAPLDVKPVDDATMERIGRLFADDRRKLEKLLGKDLSALWGDPPATELPTAGLGF